MRFVVEPRIFDFFPGLHLTVAVARGLHNTASEALAQRWREAGATTAATPIPGA